MQYFEVRRRDKENGNRAELVCYTLKKHDAIMLVDALNRRASNLTKKNIVYEYTVMKINADDIREVYRHECEVVLEDIEMY